MPTELDISLLVTMACVITIVRGQQMGLPPYLIQYAVAATGISVIWMATKEIS